MMVNVAKLQQNTARYEFADGIRDFHFAFWILVTGCYSWVVWDFPSSITPIVEFARARGSLFVFLITFILPIAVPLIISQLGMNVVNTYIRRRWLWRNTGFVKAKTSLFPRRILYTALGIAMVTFVAGILLAIQFKNPSLIIRGLYIGIGFEFTFGILALAVKFDLPRYRVVAGIGMASTIILSLLPLQLGLFCLVLNLCWAILLIMSGVYGMHQVAKQQKVTTDAA